MRRPVFIVAATAMALAASVCKAQLPYSRDMDPRETFLRTNNDPGALDAAPIVLSALGLQRGDTIRITRYGDFSYSGANTDDGKTLMAVFSSSSTLLSSNQDSRVPDAIDAGPDIDTFPTLQGALPTNIAQDFRISFFFTAEASTTLTIQIPQGATHLFLAVNDSFYGDNQDPDDDFRVTITGERAVAIDLKPGSTENTINSRSKAVLPVAILSSPTFDALSVDVATVRVSGAPVRSKGNGSFQYDVQDVNGDGLPDLIVFVESSALVLSQGATAVEVTGQTTGGLQIRGSDSIRIVP